MHTIIELHQNEMWLNVVYIQRVSHKNNNIAQCYYGHLSFLLIFMCNFIADAGAYYDFHSVIYCPMVTADRRIMHALITHTFKSNFPGFGQMSEVQHIHFVFGSVKLTFFSQHINLVLCDREKSLLMNTKQLCLDRRVESYLL